MTNILDLVPGTRRMGATAGGEFAGPCPWCGGTDRFRVWPEHPSGRVRFWCRQCERRGDGIDLLRDLKGLSFREAAAVVGQPVEHRSPASPPKLRQETPLCPPCSAWQSRAEAIACEAEAALWAPGGPRALAYLRRRGFIEATIRGARLGYVHEDRREPPEVWGLPTDHAAIWVPRGILIPWRACGATWRLNIRRPAGKPKYIGPAGWVSGLYGTDGLCPEQPAVLVEGEFDALAVAQEAGDLVAAVATGSTCSARHPRWVRRLGAASLVLVAYDDDEAGETAANWWLNRLPRTRRLVPDGDAAGMLQAGADLRAWVRRGVSLGRTPTS